MKAMTERKKYTFFVSFCCFYLAFFCVSIYPRPRPRDSPLLTITASEGSGRCRKPGAAQKFFPVIKFWIVWNLQFQSIKSWNYNTNWNNM